MAPKGGKGPPLVVEAKETELLPGRVYWRPPSKDTGKKTGSLTDQKREQVFNKLEDILEPSNFGSGVRKEKGEMKNPGWFSQKECLLCF